MLCQEVVRDTMKQLGQGRSLADIRRAIDARYRDRADKATPTPLPPEG